MVVDDSTVTDKLSVITLLGQLILISRFLCRQSIPNGPNVIKNPLQCNTQSFSSDYIGPILILVESIDAEKNLVKWHLVWAAKFFSGITNIKPAGFKKSRLLSTPLKMVIYVCIPPS